METRRDTAGLNRFALIIWLMTYHSLD